VKCTRPGIPISKDKISFTKLKWIITGRALAHDINARASDPKESFFDFELRQTDITSNERR